jgi:hypothetical protein
MASLHHIEARQLLDHLEEYWRKKYTAEQLHTQLHHLLLELKDILQENTQNTKTFSRTYLRFAAGERLGREEMDAANHALAELLKYLGMAVIGILPGAFVTLPGLYALAKHFDIDLLPEISSAEEEGKHS